MDILILCVASRCQVMLHSINQKAAILIRQVVYLFESWFILAGVKQRFKFVARSTCHSVIAEAVFKT